MGSACGHREALAAGRAGAGDQVVQAIVRISAGALGVAGGGGEFQVRHQADATQQLFHGSPPLAGC